MDVLSPIKYCTLIYLQYVSEVLLQWCELHIKLNSFSVGNTCIPYV